jgi:hypothetical protein
MTTQVGVTIKTTDEKWLSSPITSYRGTIESVREYIPTFARRTFGPSLAAPLYRGEPTLFEQPDIPAGVNPWYDAIVRMPLESEGSAAPEIPIGIVSPQYTLLQHQTVIDEALKVVGELGVDTKQITADMDLTHFGERMRLGLILPEKYSIMLKDDDKMSLRLECFNSVEGSTRFMAVIGWLRFVCSNGLIIGDIKTDYRRRHNQTMDIGEIVKVLRDGIEATTREEKIFKKWMQHTISPESLQSWVDNSLAKQWGVKAAVRAWHITRSGYDISLADPFEPGKPSEKSVIQQPAVLGAVLPGNTVFAVAQSLAWLAKERRDVQEQLLWKQQIPSLIQPLLKKRAA